MEEIGEALFVKYAPVKLLPLADQSNLLMRLGKQKGGSNDADDSEISLCERKQAEDGCLNSTVQ